MADTGKLKQENTALLANYTICRLNTILNTRRITLRARI